MQIVNVLSYEHRLHVWLLQAVLLELGDRCVSQIDLLVSCKLDKVVVPFPNSHWVLIEELPSQDYGWV